MKFFSLALKLARQKKSCDMQKDEETRRNFTNIVKSCSRNLKRCKSIQNRTYELFSIAFFLCIQKKMKIKKVKHNLVVFFILKEIFNNENYWKFIKKLWTIISNNFGTLMINTVKNLVMWISILFLLLY